MKRIAFILLLTLAACTSDNNGTEVPYDGVLLKKRLSFWNAEYTGAARFVYASQNYLHKVMVDNADGTLYSTHIYTYQGDLITKDAVHYETGENTVATFSYDDQQRLVLLEEESLRVEYSYNGDGTVLQKVFRNNDNGKGMAIDEENLHHVENGNVVLSEGIKHYYSNNNHYTAVVTKEYQYDSHPNPLSLVKGYSQIQFNLRDANNCIDLKITENPDTPQQTIRHYATAYTYDPNGYPKTAEETDTSQGTQMQGYEFIFE